MAKLITLFNQPFTIEMDGQETINGTIRDLTKLENKEFKKDLKKISSKRNEISKKQSEFQLLSDKIEMLKDKKKNDDIIKLITESFNTVKDFINMKKTLKEIYNIITNKNAINDEIIKLSEDLIIMEESFNEILKEIEDSTESEDTAKKYFNLRISFENDEMKTRTLAECEERGYDFMLNFIQEDAREKQGNDTAL